MQAGGIPPHGDFITMVHLLIKAGAVLALGSFAFAGQALAVTPFPLSGASALVIPVMDEEDQAVEQDLRPEIFPPGAQDETEESKAAKERPMGEDEGEVEQKELKEDGLEGD
jgi:hypothetical protein